MDIKGIVSDFSKLVINSEPKSFEDALKLVDELKLRLTEISIFLRQEKYYDDTINLPLTNSIFRLNELLSGYLKSEFIKRPLEVEAIAKIYAKELDFVFTTYMIEDIAANHWWMDGGQVDGRWHCVSLLNGTLQRFLHYCPDVAVENNIPNSLDTGKSEVEQYAEKLAKKVLPVFYRYELWKALGIEEKLKKGITGAERDLVISNLLNCSDKTARELHGGGYKKGMENFQAAQEYKAILTLLDIE